MYYGAHGETSCLEYHRVLNNGNSSNSKVPPISSGDSYSSAYSLFSDQTHPEQDSSAAPDYGLMAKEQFQSAKFIHPPQFPWAVPTTDASDFYKASGFDLGQTPRANCSNTNLYLVSDHASPTSYMAGTSVPYTTTLSTFSAANINIPNPQHPEMSRRLHETRAHGIAPDNVHCQSQFENAAHFQRPDIPQLAGIDTRGTSGLDQDPRKYQHHSDLDQPFYR